MQEYQQQALVYSERETTNIGFFFWVLRRRLFLIFVIVSSILLATTVYVSRTPKVYEAVSMVRLRKQALPGILQPFQQQQESEVLDLKTATQLVTTFLTVQEALELIQNGKLSSMRVNTSVKQITKSLSVQDVLIFVSVTSYDPDLIRISVKHTIPEIAAVLANGLAEAFVNRLNREAKQEAINERRFIEAQLKNTQNQLQQIDKRIAELKQQMGVVDVSEEIKTFVESIQSYTSELLTLEADLRSAVKNLSLLQQILSQERPFTSVRKENPILMEMEKQLAELESQKARLLTRYLPNHPTIKQLEQQIAFLRREISKRQLERIIEVPDAAPNQRYEILYQQILETERRKVELEEKQRTLRDLIQQTRQKLSKFPEQQRKLAGLNRQLQVLEQTYTNLLARLQDAQIREAAKLGNAIIADMAIVPNRPLGPNFLGFLSFALVGGIVLAVVLVFFLESIQTIVGSLEEVKRLLGVPILSVIPKMGKINFTEPDSMLKLMLSRHPIAETIRTLRSNLHFLIMHQHSNDKVLMVTSAVKGEGKTFVSVALSIAFAQAGKRVAVVDADMRNPTVHQLLGVEKSPGLVDVLENTASLNDALRSSLTLENLNVLPAGNLPKEGIITPAELLSSEAMIHLLQELKERFDIVILDTPPLLVVADPNALAPIVDGVLVVVEMGGVTRAAIQEMKEQLTLTQAKIIGVIVNKVSYRSTYGYYRDYYYYHYYEYR